MSDYIVIHGIKVHKDYANFVPETFGRLTTIGPKFRLGTDTFQICQCSCQKEKSFVCRSNEIRRGHTKSCGCLKADAAQKINTKHGKSRTPEHHTWQGMNKRCNNTKNKDYPDYGGRGIEVCARWREPNGQGFLNFVEDMGPRPGPEYTIERKEVNGNYCPENCEWIPSRLQGRNKRNSRMLTAFGKTQCLAAWSEEYNLNRVTISYRLRNGWSLEKTLLTPVSRKYDRK